MNPHFTKTYDVAPGSKGASQALEDQFLLLEQGFDSVTQAAAAAVATYTAAANGAAAVQVAAANVARDAAIAKALEAANSAAAAAVSAAQALLAQQAAQIAAQAAGVSAGLPALVPNTYLGVTAGGVLQWILKSAETTWLTAVNGLAKALAYTFLNKGTVAAAGTAAFLFSDGETQSVTAAGNLTVTVGGWPATGRRAELELQCINFGGKTITWPSLRWIIAGGGFTTVASSNGVTFQAAGTDYVLLWTDDGGTTVYAKVLR